ncbi:hypothetical protein NM688_g8231 [Phlebia brevispora]|uniref:Uncharacterized protein n=1 Tax=Phlebia brevispora TaxID=194682 RepID=A0ACC1RVL0_9APHY|nr:hypothetical protein NM688_g8231 [Phlebia brevispora]
MDNVNDDGFTPRLPKPIKRPCERCLTSIDTRIEPLRERVGKHGQKVREVCMACWDHYEEKEAKEAREGMNTEARGNIGFTEVQPVALHTTTAFSVADMRKGNAAAQRAASNHGDNMYPSRRFGAGYHDGHNAERYKPTGRVQTDMPPPPLPSNNHRSVAKITKGYTGNHREYEAHRAHAQQKVSSGQPAIHIGERKMSVLFAMHFEKAGKSGNYLLGNIEQEVELLPQ